MESLCDERGDDDTGTELGMALAESVQMAAQPLEAEGFLEPGMPLPEDGDDADDWGDWGPRACQSEPRAMRSDSAAGRMPCTRSVL